MKLLHIIYNPVVGLPAHWAVMSIKDEDEELDPDTRGTRYHADSCIDEMGQGFKPEVEPNKRVLSRETIRAEIIATNIEIDEKILKETAYNTKVPTHATRTNCQDWVLNFLFKLYELGYLSQEAIDVVAARERSYATPDDTSRALRNRDD